MKYVNCEKRKFAENLPICMYTLTLIYPVYIAISCIVCSNSTVYINPVYIVQEIFYCFINYNANRVIVIVQFGSLEYNYTYDASVPENMFRF